MQLSSRAIWDDEVRRIERLAEKGTIADAETAAMMESSAQARAMLKRCVPLPIT